MNLKKSLLISINLYKSLLISIYLNKSLFISLLSLLISINLYLSLFISKTVAAPKSSFYPVDVSLSIGEYRFTLFGYTSPFALVTLSGMGIFDLTYADNKGYFIFKNRFSPFSPREACLTAQDQLGRLSSPLCLPPFPTNYNVEIGPVIMPPTLSLDKENYWVGDEVILSGQTVPNSEVDLSLYANKSEFKRMIANERIRSFVTIRFPICVHSRVYAAEKNPPTDGFRLPKFTTTSDDKGNFSIALPSSFAKTFRLFAQTNFLENSSPESRKLTVKILPWWMIIVQFFIMLFSVIKSRLLEFIILLQIVGLVIYFLRRYLHPRTLAIVRRERFSLMKTN